jgi:predicted signal transduction protein with EAL and GGDEF domain
MPTWRFIAPRTRVEAALAFFEPEMDMAVRRRRRLAQELRVALLDDQFELFYQAQVRIPSTEIIGFEALLRWHHPEHGLVEPLEFIPIAEESGLIIPIGEWVLRTACREAAAWPRPYKVSVNLSPRQFQHDNFPGVVHSILVETGLPPLKSPNRPCLKTCSVRLTPCGACGRLA